MTCFCGAEIETGLAALGSTACHACRSDRRRLMRAIEERKSIEAGRMWRDHARLVRLPSAKAA